MGHCDLEQDVLLPKSKVEAWGVGDNEGEGRRECMRRETESLYLPHVHVFLACVFSANISIQGKLLSKNTPSGAWMLSRVA